LCFILRGMRMRRGQERYVQGILNPLSSMNISLLHGVWSYPYVFTLPMSCKMQTHSKVRHAAWSMIVPIHFPLSLSNIMQLFSKSSLCCVGRKFLKLGCGSGEKWNLTLTVYKAFKFALQRVEVISGHLGLATCSAILPLNPDHVSFERKTEFYKKM
jgi:hypothetical protein